VAAGNDCTICKFGIPAPWRLHPGGLCACFAEFASSARSGFVFQFSLNGQPWRQCTDTLTLGPLPSDAGYVLHVRTVVLVDGAPSIVSANCTHTWYLFAFGSSSLALPPLADGSHSLDVVAFDAELRHLRSLPLRHRWAVDTRSPGVHAAAVATVLNGDSATAQLMVTCTDELEPDACTFCSAVASGRSSGEFGPVVCPPPSEAGLDGMRQLNVSLPALDDEYWVKVSALDGAGNRGEGAPVAFVRDSVPPVISTTLSASDAAAAMLATLPGSLPPLYILPGPGLLVRVACLDVTPCTAVAAAARNGTVVANVTGVVPKGSVAGLRMPLLDDGVYTVEVSAMDAGGNYVQNTDVRLLVVDTSAPGTVRVHPATPVMYSRDSAFTFTVGCSPDELTPRGFRVVWSPALPSLPTFAPVLSPQSAVASVTALGLQEGLLTMQAWAQDEAGLEDAVGVSVTVVVDTSPPLSWFVSPLSGTVFGSVNVAVVVAGVDNLSPLSLWVQVDNLNATLVPNSSLFFLPAVPDGAHLLTLWAVDAAGVQQVTGLPLLCAHLQMQRRNCAP
jgi:hypothetical protein